MKLNATPLSMVNPSTDSLLKQTHSRYALVVLASKRARELLSGAPCRVENRANKFGCVASHHNFDVRAGFFEATCDFDDLISRNAARHAD